MTYCKKIIFFFKYCKSKNVSPIVCDLVNVSEWCDLWGMKLYASKTRTMLITKVTHNASPITRINYWQNCAEGD